MGLSVMARASTGRLVSASGSLGTSRRRVTPEFVVGFCAVMIDNSGEMKACPTHISFPGFPLTCRMYPHSIKTFNAISHNIRFDEYINKKTLFAVAAVNADVDPENGYYTNIDIRSVYVNTSLATARKDKRLIAAVVNNPSTVFFLGTSAAYKQIYTQGRVPTVKLDESNAERYWNTTIYG